jgi:hypothetical protein
VSNLITAKLLFYGLSTIITGLFALGGMLLILNQWKSAQRDRAVGIWKSYALFKLVLIIPASFLFSCIFIFYAIKTSETLITNIIR